MPVNFRIQSECLNRKKYFVWEIFCSKVLCIIFLLKTRQDYCKRETCSFFYNGPSRRFSIIFKNVSEHLYSRISLDSYSTNTPRGFYIETTWKRSLLERYWKAVQKDPKENRLTITLDFKPFRFQVKGKHYIDRAFQSLAVRGKKSC